METTIEEKIFTSTIEELLRAIMLLHKCSVQEAKDLFLKSLDDAEKRITEIV